MTDTPQEVFDFVRNSQTLDASPQIHLSILCYLRPYLFFLHLQKPISLFAIVLATLGPWPTQLSQHNLYSVGCFDKGIFLMSSASLGTNKPAITYSFQVRLSSFIRTSTIVSSQPSTTGDRTRVGGLNGNQVCCQI